MMAKERQERGYPGTDPRESAVRPRTTIGSHNLGGEQHYDPNNPDPCRCAEMPRHEWRQTPREKGRARWRCKCGRASAWCRTRREATLHWNEMQRTPERVCGPVVRRLTIKGNLVLVEVGEVGEGCFHDEEKTVLGAHLIVETTEEVARTLGALVAEPAGRPVIVVVSATGAKG